MTKRLLSAIFVSLTLALGAGLPVAHAAPPAAHTSTTSQAGQAGTATPTRAADRDADAARYAAAEKKAPDASRYEGGAVFVVVGSTTLVILGVILLIVLL